MSLKEAKAQYQFLKETGDLNSLFPSLTGEWKKDKNIFIQQYEINNEMLKENLFDLDVDYEEYN